MDVGLCIEGGVQGLIFPGVSEVPGLDNPTLGGVDIFLILDLLDTDTDAVLGEDDVLLAHALRRRLLYLGEAEIDLVADPGRAGEYDEEDDERDKLAGERRAVSTVESREGGGRTSGPRVWAWGFWSCPTTWLEAVGGVRLMCGEGSDKALRRCVERIVAEARGEDA